MDSVENNLKTAAVNTSLKSAEAYETQGSAKINTEATQSYLSNVNSSRALLAEGQQKTFTNLSSSLNEYLNNPSSLDKAESSFTETNHFSRLNNKLITRDLRLQEKIAQDLSTSKQLVRSKDAASVLEEKMKNLPESLREGSQAGTSLAKFVCQGLVNLSDYENMGAGLQKDLALKEVYPSKNNLSFRAMEATSKAVSATIDYVLLNQKNVLAKLPATQNQATVQAQNAQDNINLNTQKAQSTDTYQDIFKQKNQATQDSNSVSDEVSKTALNRVRNLISKAAESARKANLMPNADTQESKSIANNTQSTQKSDTPSLAELSAKAAKLQQQFREDRQRSLAQKTQEIAAENKTTLPESKNTQVNTNSDDVISKSNEKFTNELALKISEQVSKQNAFTKDDLKELAKDLVKEVLAQTKTDNQSQRLTDTGYSLDKYKVDSSYSFTELYDTSKDFYQKQNLASSNQVSDLNATKNQAVVEELQDEFAQELEIAEDEATEELSDLEQLDEVSEEAIDEPIADENDVALDTEKKNLIKQEANPQALVNQNTNINANASVNNATAEVKLKTTNEALTQAQAQVIKAELSALDDAETEDNLVSKMLEKTVPQDELEDSVLPSDVKKNSKNELTFTKIPDKTEGAAAITQGLQEPLPKTSVVNQTVAPEENTGFFSKIASFFSGKKITEAPKTQIDASAVIENHNLILNQPKGSPLDYFMQNLKLQLNDPVLANEIKEQAKNLLAKLQSPIDDLPSVSNWLNFSQSPLSPSSPQALAMHQWAFMLLAIRFSQLGKSVDKFLNKNKLGENTKLDESLEKITKNLGRDDNKVKNMLEDTLNQISRLQNPRHEGLANIFQYLPLPPSYEGGREGKMNIHSSTDENNEKIWNLNFVFDLEQLGGLDIKVQAKLPELKLNVIAESFDGLKHTQDNLSYLKDRFDQLGLSLAQCTVRMGTVFEKKD